MIDFIFDVYKYYIDNALYISAIAAVAGVIILFVIRRYSGH